MSRIGAFVRRAIARVRTGRDHVRVDGSVMPAPDRRWCGPEFRDDNFYLRSAEGEARRLVDHFGCTPATRVLDVGCGQGRLPIGLLRVLGATRYTGVDIHRPSIDWCTRHIQRNDPDCRFHLLDAHNERYNRAGAPIDDSFRFPLGDASCDLIYLYSVFSHTTEHDTRVYLREFRRLLADGGRVFLTAFVEDDVPDISINPPGYRLRCCGPLHVVRYDRTHLFAILEQDGFTVTRFDHGGEADGQSALYLAPVG